MSGSAPRRLARRPEPTGRLGEGQVVAAHGRQYLVELDDGETRLCFPRGKKSEIACGDRVTVGDAGDGRGVIDAIAPRTTLLYRSNEFREKLIAANVTRLVIVVACEPAFSDELVSRALIAADSQGIAPLIVLNKCDLTERVPAAEAALAPFVPLGHPILRLSARTGADALLPWLAGHTSVLVGQSGMGKSTLTNALIPEANAATREISAALDSGKHTTTHARLYRLDARSCLIDSPGLQEFGLAHLDRMALDAGFPELRDHLGRCRFRDCRHDREPGCAVREAVAAGLIDARRFTLYQQLGAEIRD